MRVLIDTNIIISAALFPTGTAAKAYYKAVSFPFSPIVAEWTIIELRMVFARKFPDHIDALESFISKLSIAVEIVGTSKMPFDNEAKIRDAKDRPILRAAINGRADIILTGDKDFLESGIVNPIIVSPGEFLQNSL